MFPDNSSGFLLRGSKADLTAVAHVLGQVGMSVVRKPSSPVTFADVFNCLSTLNHLANSRSYIANESSDSSIVTTWNNIRLATFMDQLVQGEVKEVSPSEEEKNSLRTLSASLRQAYVQPDSQ